VLAALLEPLGMLPESVSELCDLGDAALNARCLASLALHLFAEAAAVSNAPDDIPPAADGVSSALLRVCCYPASAPYNGRTGREKPPSYSFGAHTDTTVLTLGPVSRVPGLQLYDRCEAGWVPVEERSIRRTFARAASSRGQLPVTLFVGELLQVLTKKHYLATVHRVLRPRGSAQLERVSCPYLVRGKWSTVIALGGTDGEGNRLHNAHRHPGGAETESRLPDLDGVSLRLLHKMLDLKRAKCRAVHEKRVAAGRRAFRREAAARTPDSLRSQGEEGGAEEDDDDDEEDDGVRFDPSWVLASYPETTGVQ
jgi:hypothetical protein